jgi:hypothetical protein
VGKPDESGKRFGFRIGIIFFELGSGGGPNSLGGYRGTLEKTMVRVCVSSLHSSTHLGWSLK